LVAGIAGTLVSYVVAYHSSIGFMWPSSFGLAATLAVGWLLPVVLGSAPGAEAIALTWQNVVRAPTESNLEHVRHLR
jgi:hypothetical protein